MLAHTWLSTQLSLYCYTSLVYCWWGRASSPLLLQFFYWKTKVANKPSVPCGNRKLRNATFENDPRYKYLLSGLFKGWNTRAKSPELKKHKTYFSSGLAEQEAENKYSLVDEVYMLSGTKTQTTLKPGQWLPLLSQCCKFGVLEGNFVWDTWRFEEEKRNVKMSDISQKFCFQNRNISNKTKAVSLWYCSRFW